MIVDCHTQVWDNFAQLGKAADAMIEDARFATAAEHLQAVESVDRAIVLAFKSRYIEAEIPNRFVADYVRRNHQKLVGFASVDPTDHGCLDELHVAHEELRLRGVTVSPALQNFHPADTRAMAVYEECSRRGLPILFEHNHRNAAAVLDYGRPALLDEVAREFPRLRLVVAHLGYPWIEETIVLLRKHPHVYADVSGLMREPWLAYSTLLRTYESGVIDKLLFGSDFPYRSPVECIETMYSINQLSHGSNLPAVPREKLRQIVERDALALLGINEQVNAERRQLAMQAATDDD